MGNIDLDKPGSGRPYKTDFNSATFKLVEFDYLK